MGKLLMSISTSRDLTGWKYPDGHALLLCIYGTRQAARKWQRCITAWMAEQGNPPVNSEETIFMGWVGEDLIVRGLFVGDMRHNLTPARIS